MRKTPTLGTVIAVAEVDAPTWMGSNSTDTSEICTTTGGRGAMAEARFIGPTAMVDITAGMAVHTQAKGIQFILTTPRTDRDRNAFIRSTAMELD